MNLYFTDQEVRYSATKKFLKNPEILERSNKSEVFKIRILAR